MIEIGLEAWGTLLAVLCIGLGGEWFENCAVVPTPRASHSLEDAAKLWDITAKVIGLPADLV